MNDEWMVGVSSPIYFYLSVAILAQAIFDNSMAAFELLGSSDDEEAVREFESAPAVLRPRGRPRKAAPVDDEDGSSAIIGFRPRPLGGAGLF